MDIEFNDKKIKKVCNDYKEARKAFGDDVAKKLHMALNFITHAETLNDVAQMPTYRLHPLKGDRKGSYAIDLGRKLGFRLILIPLDKCGHKWIENDINLIYRSTTTIILMEVSNHYEYK